MAERAYVLRVLRTMAAAGVLARVEGIFAVRQNGAV